MLPGRRLTGLDFYVLMTIRADSIDSLLQRVPALRHRHAADGHAARPCRRDVITKPAAVYSRQVARLDLEPDDLEVDEIEECFLVVE